MAGRDELYRKTIKKIRRDRVLKFIAPIVALAFPICFWLKGTSADGGLYEPFKYLFIGAIVLVFVVPAVYNFFANFYAKPAQNLADGEICSELKELENERVNLVAAVKKASLIALVVGICAGGAVAYFWDAIFGVALGGISYALTSNLLTASKRREFRANFKRRVTENIVKKHGLTYEKDRGLGLEDFFEIYDCAVDEWGSEDLVHGEIDGVRVKFSDFYAAKKVKKKNSTETVVQFRGVLFNAGFNKKLSCVTQISHVNSRNLAIYGERANMDDARFEEIFDVYTTDQIGARYALTPALMQKFSALCLRLESRVNAVFKDDQIFIAVETWRDNFEPDLSKPLNDATVALYESEIENFTQIVKELNLNRKIWQMS